MVILGINCYGHDSSAAILDDGVPVCAVEEERFVKKKHVGIFPEQAISCCLKEAGVNGPDIDAIGFYWDPTIHRGKQFLHLMRYFPASLNLLAARKDNAVKLMNIKKEIATFLSTAIAKIQYVEHHLAHAASSFFVSPFDESAILSYDGVGEWTTTLYATGKGNKIHRIGEVYFPHSLGDFYTMMTEFCGFRHSGGEGKLMGLAPYGDPNRFYPQLRSIIQITGEGQFRLDTSYLQYHTHGKTSWYSPKLSHALGLSPRVKESQMTRDFQDVAAATQQVVGDVAVELMRWLQAKTGQKRLCIGGGLGLNSVINARILQESRFEDIFIQPAANDASGSIGAAYYLWNQVLDKPRTYVMDTAYLGPEIPDAEHLKVIESEGLKYQCLATEELLRKTAEYLADQKIVGWVQGRMEYGPRALGNRSILTAPYPKSMIDTLNNRVKHREPFRPFAPSILFEYQKDFFQNGYISPFMLLVFDTQKDKYDTIAAVDHVDHTGRVQSVRKEDNEIYYNLISEFHRRTGIPVLLNTSFNRRGEPIINSTQQAIDCFLGEDMDALVLGSFFLDKKDVPQEKLRLGGAKAID